MNKYLITTNFGGQDIMHNIYEVLLKRGLTTSQRDFSTYYAGKSPSYLATTGSLSDGALIAVFRRLLDERHWLLAVRVAHHILFVRDSEAVTS